MSVIPFKISKKWVYITMIKLKNIQSGIWVTKQNTTLLCVYLQFKQIHQLRYDINKKELTKVTYKNCHIYTGNSSEPTDDETIHQTFIKTMDTVFDNNPCWSVRLHPDVTTSDILQLTPLAADNSAVTEAYQLIQQVDHSDQFKYTNYYFDQPICTEIKKKLLWKLNPIIEQSDIPVTALSIQNQRKNRTHLAQEKITEPMALNFEGLKESCIELINDIGDGKNTLIVECKNDELDYNYAKIDHVGIEPTELKNTQLKPWYQL